MGRQSVDLFLAELEASPPSAKKQTLQQLRSMMQKQGIALPPEAPSFGPAAISGCSLWRAAAAAVGFAAALLLLGPTMGDHGRGAGAGCVCPSVAVRKPLFPVGEHRGGPEDGRRQRASRMVDAALQSSSTSSDEISQGGEVIPRSHYPPHRAFDHPRDAIRRLKPRRNTSDFPLLVCIGQGKTATKSLNKAFVMLGMNTAHFYGAGVYSLLFDNAAEQKDKEFLFNVNEEKHVAAVLDTPVVDFYNEIALAYPNAKFILTIREPRSWIKSQQKFYGHYARSCKNWLAPWRRGSNIVYGTECPSPVQAIKRYHQHNRNVIDAIPKDRLLVMDIPGGDGWEKLCPFLGVPIPDNKYGNMSFPNRH